ncbi:hypothetical protein [Haladaptatus sp. ZSTT2]|uniref:hypothetical protein n=1 Tax=Haladaptatus sp. ZSTT2 TaxID=3120515 RepID=UPI00300E7A3D
MSDSSAEADVFLSLANWLDSRDYQFYVHIPKSHHQIQGYKQVLQSYPSHTISIGPYKPDVLGITPANRVFAIEVKGTTNLRKGLGQAISYQRGVDRAHLAADASNISRIRDLSLSKGIGVLGVDSKTHEVTECNPYSVDMKDLLYNTRHQLENAQVTGTQVSLILPKYADPLNQLMPVLAVGAHSKTTKSEIGQLVSDTNYPYKREYNRMIRLAQYLGMIREVDNSFELTEQGEVGLTLLKGYNVADVPDLMNLKGGGSVKANHPPIATYLRNRFASAPDFRTLFEVLLSQGGAPISIKELCQILIDNYPSTFLNLVYTDPSGSQEAATLIEQGRGYEIYENPEYLKDIIHSQFISNTASQFRSLGILDNRSPVIEPKGALDPENHYWYPGDFQLG